MDSELDRTHTDFDPIAEVEFSAFLDEWMANKYEGLDPDQEKAEELEDYLIEKHEDEVREDAEAAYRDRRCEIWESMHDGARD